MRAGRYKYQLVTQEELLKEAPLFLERIKPLEPNPIPQNFFAQSQVTAAYIFEYSKMRYGKKFKQVPIHWEKLFTPQEFSNCLKLGPNADLSYEQAKMAYLELIEKDYFNLVATHQLRAIPFSATRSLVSWSMGFYPLHLFLSVPTPVEVLNYQTRGQRVVSLIFKGDEFVEGGREPLGFALHDLIHADHFYRDARVALGQIGFSRWVAEHYYQGHFNHMLKSEMFQKEFYYTVSDMNAYCVHLLKCLRANILNWHLEQEGKGGSDILSQAGRAQFEIFWAALFAELSQQDCKWFANLNECEKTNTTHLIESFFIAFSQSETITQFVKPIKPGNVSLQI